MSNEIRLVYVTTANPEEAKKIARTLLEERLIACANLLPGMISLYHWKGTMNEDQECVLLLKTSERNLRRLTERIKTLHSYEVPCILSITTDSINADYTKWLQSQLN